MGFLDVLMGLVGKQGWDYSERRGKIRVKCRIEASLMVGTGLIGADIVNISIKGMQLVCYGKVKKGSQVVLRGVKQYNQATHTELLCRAEWSKKKAPGWLIGVSFLDTPEQLSKSWLYWELREQGMKLIGADQKRRAYRVKCRIPGRITSRTQNLNARVINLGPGGAMIQTMGEMMAEGETVTVRFGPLEQLPKIAFKGTVASIHVKGSPTYGVEILSFETGSPEQLKLYLDYFFRD